LSNTCKKVNIFLAPVGKIVKSEKIKKKNGAQKIEKSKWQHDLVDALPPETTRGAFF
jgi:hypothetical protein